MPTPYIYLDVYWLFFRLFSPMIMATVLTLLPPLFIYQIVEEIYDNGGVPRKHHWVELGVMSVWTAVVTPPFTYVYATIAADYLGQLYLFTLWFGLLIWLWIRTILLVKHLYQSGDLILPFTRH